MMQTYPAVSLRSRHFQSLGTGSVSKARKPSLGVLSISGIRDHGAIQRVHAPAAREVHHLWPLLGPSRVCEVALPSCLHEQAVTLPASYLGDRVTRSGPAPKELHARMARVDADRTMAIVACAEVVLLALVATKKVLDSPAKGKVQSSLRRLFRRSQSLVSSVGGNALHVRQNVGVDAQGSGHVGVAQHLGHHLDRHALRQQQGRSRMP